MKKWIPAFITVAVTVVGAVAAPVQALIAAHPMAAMIVGGVYAVVKLLIPSPLQKPEPDL